MVVIFFLSGLMMSWINLELEYVGINIFFGWLKVVELSWVFGYFLLIWIFRWSEFSMRWRWWCVCDKLEKDRFLLSFAWRFRVCWLSESFIIPGFSLTDQLFSVVLPLFLTMTKRGRRLCWDVNGICSCHNMKRCLLLKAETIILSRGVHETCETEKIKDWPTIKK